MEVNSNQEKSHPCAANITWFLMLQQHFPWLCERRGYSVNKVNAIASDGKKPNKQKHKQGERRWVEEKCLVAKSFLEWLLINRGVWNLFSSPTETQQIRQFTVCSFLVANNFVSILKWRKIISYKLDIVCMYNFRHRFDFNKLPLKRKTSRMFQWNIFWCQLQGVKTTRLGQAQGSSILR